MKNAQVQIGIYRPQAWTPSCNWGQSLLSRGTPRGRKAILSVRPPDQVTPLPRCEGRPASAIPFGRREQNSFEPVSAQIPSTTDKPKPQQPGVRAAGLMRPAAILSGLEHCPFPDMAVQPRSTPYFQIRNRLNQRHLHQLRNKQYTTQSHARGLRIVFRT